MGKMGETVSNTIKSLSLAHINNGGKILGQCLTAVGWVGGTIPELPDHPNIIELSMADVAGGAIAVGASIGGNRPIYVVRYQGFLWYNIPSIVNYAAKSKSLWGVNCPLIIRAIAMEGGIGPVAGSSHISLAYRMPGIKIASPMTPNEYREVWENAINSDDPIIISEHRKSYDIDYETPSLRINNYNDFNIFCISNTRFEALKYIESSKKHRIGFYPIVWIKPNTYIDTMKRMHSMSKYGSIIIDDDYTDGIAKSMAYDLMHESYGKLVYVMGLEDKSAGFSSSSDNLPPDALKISSFIEKEVLHGRFTSSL